MKLKVLLGAVVLGIVGVNCVSIYNALGNNSVTVEQEDVADEYELAKNAIDGIHNSIKIINRDNTTGKLTLSLYNPGNYDFSNLMIDIEFVDKNGEAYYYETVFITDGLAQLEFQVIDFEVLDLTMLESVESFNFFVQGF